MNRMACLRLTQRCADILISVRQEVHDAGGDVGDELKVPIDKLVECVFCLRLHIGQGDCTDVSVLFFFGLADRSKWCINSSRDRQIGRS